MPAPSGLEQDLLDLEARIVRLRDVPSAREELSEALLQRAFTLQTLGRLEDAVAGYHELASAFIAASEDAIRRDVVRGLQQRGHLLHILGRDAEADASLEEAAAVGGDLARPTSEQQLRADLERASDLEHDGRYGEALEVLGDIIRPWEHVPPKDAAELVAYAPVLAAQTAVRAGPNIEAALQTCDQVVASYGESADPGVRSMVVWALTTRGWVHACAKRYDDAAAACARAIEYAGEHEDPRIRDRAQDGTHSEGALGRGQLRPQRLNSPSRMRDCPFRPVAERRLCLKAEAFYVTLVRCVVTRRPWARLQLTPFFSSCLPFGLLTAGGGNDLAGRERLFYGVWLASLALAGLHAGWRSSAGGVPT